MKKIYIVLFEKIDTTILEKVERGVNLAFGAKIDIVEAGQDGFNLMRSAFEPRRQQYFSVKILDHLPELIPASRNKSSDTFKILGVTEKDLATPVLTFVFGEAQLEGSSAIISLARLKQEFYELIPNQKVLLERAVKEAIHELGHTFGLRHCDNNECVMRFSPMITGIDQKDVNFCMKCLKYLQKAI